nr:non-specific lipid-transfer protein 1-like [Ziziphus jujuba var. spinosa]
METKYAIVATLACIMLVAISQMEATITCGQVTKLLTPCISYAVLGGTVAPECCAGIKELHAIKITTEDIRTACSCIKQGAAMIPGINYDRVNELPGKCNTTSPYKIYPSTDCSKYTLQSFSIYYVF